MRVDDAMDSAIPDGDRRTKTSMTRFERKPRTDKLDISPESRQVERSADELADIRIKIENGVYTRPCQLSAIAEKLIGENLFGDKSADDPQADRGEQPVDISGIRPDRVDEARKKASRGEYSSSKVLQSIIERILGQFGIR